MYLAQTQCQSWVYVPRDDVIDSWDLLARTANQVMPNPMHLGPLTIHQSGAYQCLTLRDDSTNIFFRAVGRISSTDKSADRMVLDMIGARDCEDPPGSPWAVYSPQVGVPSADVAHQVAAIMYALISANANQRSCRTGR